MPIAGYPKIGDIIQSAAFAGLENGKGDADYIVIRVTHWTYSKAVTITALELVGGVFMLFASTITFDIRKGSVDPAAGVVELEQILYRGHREMVLIPLDEAPDWIRK